MPNAFYLYAEPCPSHTHPFSCVPECERTTFDVFYNCAREQWGVRELASGDVRRITFHHSLLYLLEAFRGTGLPLKVQPAVSAWSCTLGRCRCYRA